MLSGSCVILFVAGTLCATVPQTTTPDLCRQGQQLIREGKFQQALEAASQALTLDPSSAEAEEVAGTAQFGLGNLPSAQQHMQRALALQPNRVTARRALGATFLRERQLK
jgi:Flp pilus assembly protein TadD